jgi:hypothetical protein
MRGCIAVGLLVVIGSRRQPFSQREGGPPAMSRDSAVRTEPCTASSILSTAWERSIRMRLFRNVG